LPEEFGARLARQGMASGTIRKYVQGARDFLCWLGDADPAAATRADVENYLDSLGVSPATSRARIASLKRLYDYLDSKGLLVDADGRERRSPVERVERPRSRRRANDWLSDEEDAALMGAVIDAREDAVISLMRWAGLRVGEACNLGWHDVDLKRD